MKLDIRLKRSAPLRLRYTPGATGPAGTIQVGTVSTGAPGSSVNIQNVGTPENAVLDITIPRGDTGATGNKGWSPILAVVQDGTRYVLQVADWTGGQGAKPTAGLYIGPTGLTNVLADAINIRGPQGPSGSVTDGDKGDIVVSSSGTAWTIDADAVDNAKLANMPTMRLKGRISSGLGDPEDLTPSDARAVLQISAAGEAMILAASASVQTALLLALVGDAGSGGAKGLAPAPAAGDAAAGKALLASGAWGFAGKVVDRAYDQYATYAGLTNAIPADNTIPQSGEGTQILTATLTPKSTTHRFRVAVLIVGADATSSGATTVAVFRNGQTDAIKSAIISQVTGNFLQIFPLIFEFVPGVTSAVTVTVRVGPSAGTFRANGNGSQQFMGGSSACALIVDEIAA